MSHSVRIGFSRTATRLALAGLATTFLAGCSSDFSRFNDSESPFQSSARMDTSSGGGYGNQSSGYQPQQMASAAPISPVQTAPLTPIQSAPLNPVVAQQGAPVRAAALRPAAVAPLGQPNVIAAAPVRAPAHAPAMKPQTIAAAPVAAKPAALPKAQTIAAAPVATPLVAKAEPRVTAVPKSEPAPAPKVVAEAPAQKPVRTAALEPQTAKSDAAPVATTATAASEEGTPEFRWPARGRIIQGFKAGASEGINIAVPEGTSVKAAEGGTVAYAGSELKGYGNLVLIRHPNGFVSAYAHNGELMVKRGESVKRGQVIAKSGQTGNVSSPQLQFQLRKGSTPVDPTQYLAGL